MRKCNYHRIEYCKRTGDVPLEPDNLNPTRTTGPKD